jgi:hypothetical protein
VILVQIRCRRKGHLLREIADKPVLVARDLRVPNCPQCGIGIGRNYRPLRYSGRIGSIWVTRRVPWSAVLAAIDRALATGHTQVVTTDP